MSNDDQSWRRSCMTCDGSGKITRYINGSSGMEIEYPCPECGDG